MALRTRIAYDLERNLGRAYNDEMALLAPGDWACFLDHDATFTTRDWYPQVLKAITENRNAGLLTAVTNRIGRKTQIAPGAPQNHDIAAHRIFGEELQKRHGARGIDVTRDSPISGVVMCLSRETWEAMGKFKDGFFGVDNCAHRDVAAAGKRVYMLPGLYVYHWYRGDGRGHEGAPRASRG